MNKKTTVRLVGGLGNQLFGMFFGLAVSKQLRNALVVDDKLLSFGSNKHRRMEVSNIDLNVPEIKYKRSLITKFIFFRRVKTIRKVFWFLLNWNKKVVSEDDVSKTEFKFTEGQTYAGYFQDWFYADLVFETNKDFKFSLKNSSLEYLELKNKLTEIQPICVHVRLGDYLEFPEVYNLLPEYYYLDSINYLDSDNIFKIWLFTESRSQVKEYYPQLFDKVDKILDRDTQINDVESFFLLSSSSKLVASNSTFSMWAAWFAEKKRKSQAVLPLQQGIRGISNDLVGKRWDRYDLINRRIVQKSGELDTFLSKKTIFESKF